VSFTDISRKWKMKWDVGSDIKGGKNKDELKTRPGWVGGGGSVSERGKLSTADIL
jgi:hypothetical protein